MELVLLNTAGLTAVVLHLFAAFIESGWIWLAVVAVLTKFLGLF